jgi:hypothetical protein
VRSRALFVLLLLVAGARAAAQEPAGEDPKARWEQLTPEQKAEKLRLYEQRWKNLPPEERARRMELFEAQLKGLSPEQREDLLKRLKEIRRRRDIEELRARHENLSRIERHLLKDLPPELRARIAGLPKDRRGRVMGHVLRRIAEEAQARFFAWLSPEQRGKLLAAEGKDRLRRLAELEREQALVRLAPEALAAIRKLPAPEQEERVAEVVREVRARRHDEARRVAETEITKLLDRPVEEADVVLKLSRLGRTLRELDITDPEVRARLARAPVPRLRTLLDDLRAAPTPEARRTLLDAFLSTLED